jgi:hypothetical protein
MFHGKNLKKISHRHSHNYLLDKREDIISGWVADLDSDYYAKAYDLPHDPKDIVIPVKINFIPIIHKIKETYKCTNCDNIKTKILSDSDNATYQEFKAKISNITKHFCNSYDFENYYYEKNDIIENYRQIYIYDFRKFNAELQKPRPYRIKYDSKTIAEKAPLIQEN